MRFLVIGIGSIGERHIKNLVLLGIDVSVFDTKADVFTPESGLPEITPQISKMARIVEEYGVNFENPFSYHNQFDAYVICTPPNTHTEYIVEGMQHYSNIFVEKPISDKLDYLDWVVNTARNKEIIVQVGYQLRIHSGLKLVKQLIKDGRIGKLLNIKAEFGQYLPDWHPDSDYRRSYTARKSEGGGIILDASHEIDYVRWLADSEVTSVSCVADQLSELTIDVEDTADMILTFENEVKADIHLDMTNKTYTRKCVLTGSKGSIIWDYTNPLVFVAGKYINVAKSDPYIDEMKHFIACIENKEQPLVNAAVGKRVLEIALAAKQSSVEGRVIEI